MSVTAAGNRQRAAEPGDRRRAANRTWSTAAFGFLFILPAMALYVTFSAYPLIRGLMISFSDYRYLIPNHQPFNGIANFVEMANDPFFWDSFQRSIFYAAIYAPLNIGLALAVALLISKVINPFEAGVYRVVSYLPVVLPIAVALLLWRQLLHPQFGYVNYFLRDILGMANPPGWLTDPDWVVPTMAIAAAWKHVGTNILLFLIGLYNINNDYYEAAGIDGAGGWQKLRFITLPLLRPTLTVVLVLTAGVLGTAEESLILFGTTQSGPENAGMLVGRYAYEIAFLVGDRRWGYAAAINLTMGIISMLLVAVVFRLSRSERTE